MTDPELSNEAALALSSSAACCASSALYTVEGTVLHGKALGRTFGYPTVNLALDCGTEIPTGVYAAACLVRGTWYAGVSSVGTRPTVHGEDRNCETHLLGFSGDLYGETVRVCLCRRLREERAFSSVEALFAEIRHNAKQAQSFFLSRSHSGKEEETAKYSM